MVPFLHCDKAKEKAYYKTSLISSGFALPGKGIPIHGKLGWIVCWWEKVNNLHLWGKRLVREDFAN